MMVLEFHMYLPYDSFTSGCYSFPCVRELRTGEIHIADLKTV